MSPPNPTAPEGGAASGERRERLRLLVRGVVQGVGFRPFIHRLAGEMGIAGWVANGMGGVSIEAEGSPGALRHFMARVESDRPPHSAIHGMESAWLEPAGLAGFEIRESGLGRDGGATAVLPDIATCAECLRELFDPSGRRYRYPFITCTHCGPRYSIITSLPYDRERTTMRRFRMCDACRAEYEDPTDRRFHAEPNACPACGPRMRLLDETGRPIASRDEAVRAAAGAIRMGRIVAVKGLGGYHLFADACSGPAVARLRERKRRDARPLAVMFPSLGAAAEVCAISPEEERALLSPEAPIVLLARHPAGMRRSSWVCDEVAPGNRTVGAMLPYTPLHHLLMAELGFPVVATSGNLHESPICITEQEALSALGGIADLFLIHNRPIERRAEDSVLRVVLGREMVLRRGRGFAPLPLPAPDVRRPVLAVGAFLKNAPALGADGQIFVAPHVGDLRSPEARELLRKTSEAMAALFRVNPERVACDLHPDYPSTLYARSRPEPEVAVQHHEAHAWSCMADNDLSPPALAVAWDGTGHGRDGTVWGGEFFRAGESGMERVAWLRPFRLPGGERAAEEPRRSAAGALFAAFGAYGLELADCPSVRAFEPAEMAVLKQALARGLNAPETTSAGRLFDAAASILGLRQIHRFEGDAAIELEQIADGAERGTLPFELLDAPGGGAPWAVNWTPAIRALVEGMRAGTPPTLLSARFHETLSAAIVAVAERAGESRVLLTGGCFQNARLLVRTVERLREAGFTPFWHQRIPPNDGGIAAGQILAISRGAV